MAVRPFTVEDVAQYRAVRLEALQADPAAFGSSYEREAAFDDADWRQRLCGRDGRPGVVFVDEPDSSGPPEHTGPVSLGTAGIFYTEWYAAPMLVGMWVRPSARGQGVGRRLIDAAINWAADQQAEEVVLWVVQDNEPAIELYRRYGFVPSGKVDAVPSNPCAEELEMRYRLVGGSETRPSADRSDTESQAAES